MALTRSEALFATLKAQQDQPHAHFLIGAELCDVCRFISLELHKGSSDRALLHKLQLHKL